MASLEALLALLQGGGGGGYGGGWQQQQQQKTWGVQNKFQKPKAQIQQQKPKPKAQIQQPKKKGGGNQPAKKAGNQAGNQPRQRVAHVPRPGVSSGPRSRLGEALKNIMSKSEITKSDLMYECVEVPEGQGNPKFKCVLSIPGMPPGKNMFQGKVANNKKEAMNDAAEKALKGLNKEVREAETFAKTRKAAKNKEQLTALKAAHKEKKAAKRAAEGLA